MSGIKLFILACSKFYVDSYTKSALPVACIGFQLPDILHKKEYTRLPFLFLFPVCYTSFRLGLECIEKPKPKE